MALSYLLDEHLRRPLWHAIGQHNATGVYPIDVLRVGDAPAPPLGTTDPDLLVWLEAHGRVLVTEDRQTMLTHLAAHLAAGACPRHLHAPPELEDHPGGRLPRPGGPHR